ncbi:hypothetical protein ACQPZP_33300 [Spirillospora sp. CA-142024]|uniref:hypothetical protein n=1 Tax=Spirillospora sp. CA-142024 TaxID=3240036 RepID=UPI003D91AF9B
MAFITFTGAVPLWLVTDRGLATDHALLGQTLAAFSLAAGLGAVLGGLLGARFGFARVTNASLTLGVLPLLSVLVLPTGPGVMIAAAPDAPAATAGIVIGIGNALAGLLYLPVGALQGVLGLAPAMALTFALLIPAAGIAHHSLRRIG